MSTNDFAILLATLPDVKNPHFLIPVVTVAVNSVKKRLVIGLFSRFFDPRLHPPTAQWDDIQRVLTCLYAHATKVALDSGNLLLSVDVLLLPLDGQLPADFIQEANIVFRVEGDCLTAPLPLSVLSLHQNYINLASIPEAPSTTPPASTENNLPSLYPVVALGGTFDHLHAGHKILLSMAAWIASEKVIVGTTADSLLKNKAYKEVLESIETRKEHVRRFLHAFKPSLILDITPIDDVLGPTGWDPNIQALVVSKETTSGASAIHEHRSKKSLPALKTFVIDVIASDSSSVDHDDAEILKQLKLSSTYIREWIVKNTSQ